MSGRQIFPSPWLSLRTLIDSGSSILDPSWSPSPSGSPKKCSGLHFWPQPSSRGLAFRPWHRCPESCKDGIQNPGPVSLESSGRWYPAYSLLTGSPVSCNPGQTYVQSSTYGRCCTDIYSNCDFAASCYPSTILTSGITSGHYKWWELYSL